MRKLISILSVGAALLVAGLFLIVPALADPIGGSGSTFFTCQGSMYTLSYSGTALPDLDLLNETYRVTLTIDTGAYTGGAPISTLLPARSVRVL